MRRFPGLQAYMPIWRAMQAFTDARGPQTADELWMVEHEPVFTLGQAGKWEHVLMPGDIPVVPVDRGGQVTYHGPGQLVIYPLLNLRRHVLGVRELVVALENGVINYLAALGIEAAGRRDAPGVYFQGRKLASVGLRIRRGASYHGMALNVSMDLSPFDRINVCGYRGMQVVQLRDLGGPADVMEVAHGLAPHLLQTLGYSAINTASQAVSSR